MMTMGRKGKTLGNMICEGKIGHIGDQKIRQISGSSSGKWRVTQLKKEVQKARPED